MSPPPSHNTVPDLEAAPRSVLGYLILTTLAANVFFLGLVFYQIKQSRLQHETEAQLNTQNLSRVIAGHLEADIGKIDIILQVLADEVEKQMAVGPDPEGRLEAFFDLQHSRMPVLLGLRMADANGDILHGSQLRRGNTSNIADRSYFLAQKHDAKAGLVISEPVFGRLVKKWIVVLSRRVNKPDGSFAGAVYAMLPTEYFDQLFSSVDVGTNGSISLRDKQMALMLRHPIPEEFNTLIGSRNVSPELIEAAAENPTSGTYHTDKAFDKIIRTYSYCFISNAKTYVVVGLASDDYFATWRSQTGWTLLLALLFPIGTIGAAVAFHRGLRQRARTLNESRRMEAQLQQAQKLEALGLLAGGTAHEFNNMLGVMMANCELVKMDLPADHPLQADLAEIIQAGLQAKDIVQQILTFSRQQSESYKFIDLRATVQDALAQVRKLLPDSVEVKIDIAEDSPLISGNSTQIHQVVTNLFMNAWHALPDDRGTISLSLHIEMLGEKTAAAAPGLRKGEYWKLVITDTGKGMDEATLARIFEPFFTTKGFGKGSGLGLAVVHGIIQAHKGAIQVLSEPGKGSSFEVYFPARREALSAPEKGSRSQLAPGRHQRILLVDDEKALSKAMSKQLRRSNYQPHEAHSGEEALHLLRTDKQPFDLVITDLTMPGMDGVELARRLQTEFPKLPVVLASGFVLQGGPVENFPPNIRARLQKPYSPEALLRCLQDLLAPDDQA